MSERPETYGTWLVGHACPLQITFYDAKGAALAPVAVRLIITVPGASSPSPTITSGFDTSGGANNYVYWYTPITSGTYRIRWEADTATLADAWAAEGTLIVSSSVNYPHT